MYICKYSRSASTSLNENAGMGRRHNEIKD